jgi:hypothetical protein
MKNTPGNAFDGESLLKVMELMDTEAREGDLPQDQNALTSALRSQVVEKFDQLMQSLEAAAKWYMVDEQMTEMQQFSVIGLRVTENLGGELNLLAHKEQQAMMGGLEENMDEDGLDVTPHVSKSHVYETLSVDEIPSLESNSKFSKFWNSVDH